MHKCSNQFWSEVWSETYSVDSVKYEFTYVSIIVKLAVLCMVQVRDVNMV